MPTKVLFSTCRGGRFWDEIDLLKENMPLKISRFLERISKWLIFALQLLMDNYFEISFVM
jgi:hypothetical protein